MSVGGRSWVLSVLIPAFNEKNTIREILRRVCSLDLPKQIVIVDDGSTDGTAEFLRRLSEDEKLRRQFTSLSPHNEIDVCLQPENRGKGAALRRAVELATGDFIVFQDADLEYDPQDYFRLVEPILDGRADVVYGSRFVGFPRRAVFFRHSLANRFLTLLSNLFTNLNLTDMETCYKMFRADVLKSIRIESDRFTVEPEITAKLANLRFRIYEVPISYSGRDYLQGKKIGWKDGVAAVWAIVKFSLKDPLAGSDDRQLALRRLRQASHYSAWIYSRIAPHIGQRVLEVGAGAGNFSRYFLGADQLYLVEPNPGHVRLLQGSFAGYSHVRIFQREFDCGLPCEVPPGVLDTIVCLNVLEYVDRDLDMLREFYHRLGKGGRLILLAPASRWLFGSLDESFKHRRRYDRADLSEKLEKTGFQVRQLSYFNLAGSLGWYLNSRILRRRSLPGVQLRLFDWTVPLLRLEQKISLPFGLSLIAIAVKDSRPATRS